MTDDDHPIPCADPVMTRLGPVYYRDPYAWNPHFDNRLVWTPGDLLADTMREAVGADPYPDPPRDDRPR